MNAIEFIDNEVKEKGNGIPTRKQQQKYEFLGEYKILISNLIEQYEKKDLQGYLAAEKAIDIHGIKGATEGITFMDEKSKEEYEYHIEKLDILASKNITPIFEDNCMEGYNFLRLCSSNIIIIVLVMLMMVLLAECFSSEVEKGTYKLFFIQPVSKTKIFFSKFFVRLIVLTVVLGVVIIGTFLILGLKNGFGNLEYPTSMYKNGKVVFVSLKEFLHASVPLLIAGLLFIFCFCILISCVFNNTSTAVSIAIPGLCLCMGAIISSLKAFLPFSYIAVNDFLSSSQYGVMNGNTIEAILFLLISCACMVVGALFVLNRKTYQK